eukprot:TRINITY_DN4629_c0_g1_i1.p1 TRINITY_DN4629_c0_g1~~TRINITY_DN4629_c0_g1_i1.p1  ORF type:complete len:116 (-),score=13.55 TRINITY_DN4629_c0_g1_i1:70-417(-)
MISHVSIFDTDAAGKPSANRIHVEPGITIPVGYTWGTWTTEARLLGTYYQQDLDGVDTGAGSDYEGLEESVSRVIPEFRSHAGIVLERDTKNCGQLHSNTRTSSSVSLRTRRRSK